jgi:HEPN domain-containing protein
MKPRDVAVRELVLQWLDKAAAEQLSAQGGRFREIVAFHCQQAVEKYLKALLVRRQVEFQKTHDIAKLLDRVATVNANIAELNSPPVPPTSFPSNSGGPWTTTPA